MVPEAFAQQDQKQVNGSLRLELQQLSQLRIVNLTNQSVDLAMRQAGGAVAFGGTFLLRNFS